MSVTKHRIDKRYSYLVDDNHAIYNEVDLLAGGQPFALRVARGQIPGAFMDIKFGTNPGAGTDWEVVRQAGGLIDYPSPDLSVAQPLSISSDSVNDVNLTGTGAWTIGVAGLDADGNLQQEVVALNGQTPVNTVQSFSRVFRLWVETASPNGDSRGGQVDGIVYCGRGTVTGGVPAIICVTIVNGQNQSQICALTVPKGFTAHIVYAAATTVKDKEFEFGLFTRDTQLPNSAFRMRGNTSLYRDAFQQNFEYVAIPELHDIEIQCKNLTTGSDLVTATLIILYIPNSTS